MSFLSTLVSISKFRCPRCHKGKIFTDLNPFHLKKLYDMPEKCPCCGQRIELEPGFFYGAMYCSYGLSVGLFLANFFILHIWLGVPGVWFIIFNTVILLVLWPLIFRYARTIYLYLFVPYDQDALKKDNLN